MRPKSFWKTKLRAAEESLQRLTEAGRRVSNVQTIHHDHSRKVFPTFKKFRQHRLWVMMRSKQRRDHVHALAKVQKQIAYFKMQADRAPETVVPRQGRTPRNRFRREPLV